MLSFFSEYTLFLLESQMTESLFFGFLQKKLRKSTFSGRIAAASGFRNPVCGKTGEESRGTILHFREFCAKLSDSAATP